jgi:hypothetical protein
MSQDPGDPAYLARWQKALPKSDSLLIAIIGRRAVTQLVQVNSATDSSGE